MQLKMEETTKTPKVNKKTPKKINVKATPLKKDVAAKTPKATANTPKLNKKTPKKNANATPKPGKQQQQKTPQKGNKTPQSKQNTPKTPESNSQKSKPRNRSNKKQKLNNNKSKQISTDSDGKQSKEATAKSNESIVTEDSIKIILPINKPIPSKVLQKIFGEFEQATFTNRNGVVIKYNPGVVSKKETELRNLKIGTSSLNIRERKGKTSPLKRAIRLFNAADQENAKKFYNAKSVENLINRNGEETKIYVLTFETEEEAVAASQKKFKVGNKNVRLFQYYDNGKPMNKPEEGKVESEKQGKKQKPSQGKQAKNAQVKRKAEEEDSEDEEDEDEEDLFDFDGNDIDMNDDDDDEEEEEDDE